MKRINDSNIPSVITYRIRFIATCPMCNYSDTQDIRGLGKSHQDWINGLAPTERIPDWHCNNCNESVTAILSGVISVQD